MRLLLDTCTFLWLVSGDPALSQRASELVTDGSNDVFLNFASSWEIAIKYTNGKLPLHQPPEEYVPDARRRHGIVALPLAEQACLRVHLLPQLHRDPCDRLLVCHALIGGMTILTPDPRIRQYPVATDW